MFSIAIFYLSFGLITGLPVDDSRITKDSTHYVVALPQSSPATEATILQIDARTIAVLQLRRRSRSNKSPYPRNLDRREGYTPALEERIETVGPVVPQQEKHPQPAEPQNL